MTYFVVMGSLALSVLSVLFMLGWALSRLLRWVAAGFPLKAGGKSKKAGRKPVKRSGATRKAPKDKALKGKALKEDSAAAKSSRSASVKSKVRPQSQPKSVAKPPSQPWRITQQLAKWHSSTAFAVVTAFLYLVARLAEHGISFRPPHTLPSGFTPLVSGLGWLAAGLILLSCLHRLAIWRCNRAEK